MESIITYLSENIGMTLKCILTKKESIHSLVDSNADQSEKVKMAEQSNKVKMILK